MIIINVEKTVFFRIVFQEQLLSEIESFCNIKCYHLKDSDEKLHQGWIKLIKTYSKDIYNVAKSGSFELSIH